MQEYCKGENAEDSSLRPFQSLLKSSHSVLRRLRSRESVGGGAAGSTEEVAEKASCQIRHVARLSSDQEMGQIS